MPTVWKMKKSDLQQALLELLFDGLSSSAIVLPAKTICMINGNKSGIT